MCRNLLKYMIKSLYKLLSHRQGHNLHIFGYGKTEKCSENLINTKHICYLWYRIVSHFCNLLWLNIICRHHLHMPGESASNHLQQYCIHQCTFLLNKFFLLDILISLHMLHIYQYTDGKKAWTPKYIQDYLNRPACKYSSLYRILAFQFICTRYLKCIGHIYCYYKQL